MTDDERRLEKLYTEVMERHGTDAYTAEDDKFAKDYRASQKADKADEGSEDVSLGDSSSTSPATTPSSNDKSVKSPQSPAPTTAQPSKVQTTESSTARSTGGSGRGTH